MIEPKKGMAFYPDNANTKFWIYKRNGVWNFVYPFRHPNLHMQGYKIPCESYEEALDELYYGLSTIK